MAKASSIARQARRKRLVDLAWEKRQQLKKMVRNEALPMEERLEAQRKLNKMPRDTSPVRLRNRCKITGRSRGYLRKFGLSRLCFREYANLGMIPGIVKASW